MASPCWRIRVATATSKPAAPHAASVGASPARAEVPTPPAAPRDVEAPRADVRAEPERIVWTLVVRPASATVSVDGRAVATRDGVLVLREPRGVSVMVRAEAPGHRARALRVSFERDDSQVWTLEGEADTRCVHYLVLALQVVAYDHVAVFCKNFDLEWFFSRNDIVFNRIFK